MNLPIERIYAIDTLGTYPVAFVRYAGCSPQWEQYQNDEQIKNYIANHSDYVVNDPYWKY
jgi:hypothetical protein